MLKIDRQHRLHHIVDSPSPYLNTDQLKTDNTDLIVTEEDLQMEKPDIRAYSSIKPKEINAENPYEKKFKDYGVLNLELQMPEQFLSRTE